MKNLVLVESPSKSKTIEKFLGPDFKVLATYGHIRDLPKSKLGIDIENNFEPHYIIPIKSRKQVNILKKEAQKAKTIYLATDLDREGEAIAWHLVQALGLNEIKNQKSKIKNGIKRIKFYEITPSAIKNAIANPEEISLNLVNAQQGRRVLDRLVGYHLSPLLWKKIKRGLSAGRVQSVALKLIVDREREIEAFKPEEYWEIKALLSKLETSDQFEADLIRIDGQKVNLKNKNESQKRVADLEKANYQVSDIKVKNLVRSPAPPFITSTLQQEAARRFGFSAKRTMVIAQQLYEGTEIAKERIGLITYMRTDSFHLANEAIKDIRNSIIKTFGQDYLSPEVRTFKKKVRGAQEAHEAIRPTYIFKTPESLKPFLTPEQLKIYNLIWKRTLASQMKEALFEQTIVEVEAKSQSIYLLRASDTKLKFSGFMKIYKEIEENQGEEKNLPKLQLEENLKLIKLIPLQKFTLPPARYTEASLIKTLEENGIGRPSTYAPTISTIKERRYVEIKEKYFYPREIGLIVNDFLVKGFPEVIDVRFTAEMEKELDEIAEGKIKWQEVLKNFWEPFSKDLKESEEKMEKINLPVKETNEICDKCGRPMVIKEGRYGEFLACSGFPECKNAKMIVKSTNIKCPECQEGDLIEKRTKKGRIFYGCSTFPECNFATWNEPADICKTCGYLIVKQGKTLKCLKCGKRRLS